MYRNPGNTKVTLDNNKLKSHCRAQLCQTNYYKPKIFHIKYVTSWTTLLYHVWLVCCYLIWISLEPGFMTNKSDPRFYGNTPHFGNCIFILVGSKSYFWLLTKSLAIIHGLWDWSGFINKPQVKHTLFTFVLWVFESKTIGSNHT